MSVAIAADPRPPSQKRTYVEGLARIKAGKGVFQFANDRGGHVEQRPLEDIEPRPHLVERRRPHGAGFLRAIERADRFAKLPQRVGPVARRQSPVVEPVEPQRHVGEVIENGAAARLRGVRGEHRHDEETPQKRPHVVRSDAGVLGLFDGRGNRFGDRSRAPIATAKDPHPVLFLGDVHQLQLLGQDVRDVRELRGAQSAHANGKGLASGAAPMRPKLRSRAPERVDGGERIGAGALFDGVVE
jgi:hypothetical protein